MYMIYQSVLVTRFRSFVLQVQSWQGHVYQSARERSIVLRHDVALLPWTRIYNKLGFWNNFFPPVPSRPWSQREEA